MLVVVVFATGETLRELAIGSRPRRFVESERDSIENETLAAARVPAVEAEVHTRRTLLL